MRIEIKRDSDNEDRYHVSTKRTIEYDNTLGNDWTYRSRDEVLEIVATILDTEDYD